MIVYSTFIVFTFTLLRYYIVQVPYYLLVNIKYEKTGEIKLQEKKEENYTLQNLHFIIIYKPTKHNNNTKHTACTSNTDKTHNEKSYSVLF